MTSNEVPENIYDLGAALAAAVASHRALTVERDDAAYHYIARMQEMCDRGQVEAVAAALEGFKIVYGPGWSALASNAGIPSLAALRSQIRSRCNDGDGKWVGQWPLSQEDARPSKGTWVVYQLVDGGDLVYIGSTGQLYERLYAHARTKHFDEWRAAECEDERNCRDLETALIDRYRPRLNRMIPTPRVVLT